MRTRCPFLILALAIASLQAAGPKARSADAKAASRARKLACAINGELATLHLSRQAPNDLISRRAWTNLLDSCDGDRMVFTAEDIAGFARAHDVLDDALRLGDFACAYQVRDLFRARLRERTAFATNLLAQGTFDFSGHDTYAYERSKADWPPAGAARDALWTARIRGEVLDEWLGCETGGVARAASVVAKSYADMLAAELKRKPAETCDDFIVSVVSAYDAHTAYLPPDDFETFRQEMDLTLCGIGAVWTKKGGALKIKRVMPGGPLAKDGRIHAGDVILGVAPRGGDEIVKISETADSDLVTLFRGAKGTKITLEVKHANGEIKRYTLVRDDVQMDDDAASSQVVTADVGGKPRPLGYLRLPSFDSTLEDESTEKARSCADDLRAELEKLKKSGVAGVLFDLRDNNGGSLADAVKVVGLFVRQGPAVRIRTADGETMLPVPDGAVACEVPVVVLTNRGSASAGELVPAALQDLGRAVVAGDDRTFGKGTAQAVSPLENRGGGLVVTDARFYRVTGGSTQFKGVVPDILLPSLTEDEVFKGEQGLSYPLPWDELAPAAFTPSWDLTRFVSELRTASEARRAKNPAWRKHLRLVKDAAACVQRTEMPLNRDARKAQFDRDEAVNDELDRQQEEGFDPLARDKDLVLDEGLDILADLVRLNDGRTLPAAKPFASADSGIFDGIDDD